MRVTKSKLFSGPIRHENNRAPHETHIFNCNATHKSSARQWVAAEIQLLRLFVYRAGFQGTYPNITWSNSWRAMLTCIFFLSLRFFTCIRVVTKVKGFFLSKYRCSAAKRDIKYKPFQFFIALYAYKNVNSCVREGPSSSLDSLVWRRYLICGMLNLNIQ